VADLSRWQTSQVADAEQVASRRVVVEQVVYIRGSIKTYFPLIYIYIWGGGKQRTMAAGPASQPASAAAGAAVLDIGVPSSFSGQRLKGKERKGKRKGKEGKGNFIF